MVLLAKIKFINNTIKLFFQVSSFDSICGIVGLLGFGHGRRAITNETGTLLIL